MTQLDAIVRRGYSDDGREAMRILLFVVVIAIAYIVGRSSH